MVRCTFICLAREAVVIQEREAEGDGEGVEEIIVPCRNDAQLEKYLACVCVCVCVCVCACMCVCVCVCVLGELSHNLW